MEEEDDYDRPWEDEEFPYQQIDKEEAERQEIIRELEDAWREAETVEWKEHNGPPEIEFDKSDDELEWQANAVDLTENQISYVNAMIESPEFEAAKHRNKHKHTATTINNPIATVPPTPPAHTEQKTTQPPPTSPPRTEVKQTSKPSQTSPPLPPPPPRTEVKQTPKPPPPPPNQSPPPPPQQQQPSPTTQQPLPTPQQPPPSQKHQPTPSMQSSLETQTSTLSQRTNPGNQQPPLQQVSTEPLNGVPMPTATKENFWPPIESSQVIGTLNEVPVGIGYASDLGSLGQIGYISSDGVMAQPSNFFSFFILFIFIIFYIRA
jgi:hypothetical protein